MICRKSDNDSIQKCISSLKKGGIVIIPTDTVYGFSGIVDGKTDSIIRKIKGREEYKPFIQLISSPQEIYNYTDDVIPQKLLDYWPGPLTIIVNRKGQNGSGEYNGERGLNGECELNGEQARKGPGLQTLALRCPGDEWLRKVIAGCGASVYSTSVNRSGQPVLDSEAEIISEFSEEVDLIVADGDRKSSVPSTIVKVEAGSCKIIRQGAIKLQA